MRFEFPFLKKEPPIQERRNPLKPGEIFSPELALRQIRTLPRGEQQHEALSIFKEKLTYQTLGWSRFQEKLFTHLQAHPDISFDTLTKNLKKYREQYGFSDADCKLALRVFRAYQERRAVIQNTLKTYLTNEKLFKALFGAEPQGRLERIESPIAIYLRIHNKDDYTWIRSKAFLTKTKKVIPSKKRWGIAAKLDWTFIRKLRNAVCVERADDVPFEGKRKQIFKHEQQHVLYRFFLDNLEEKISKTTLEHSKKIRIGVEIDETIGSRKDTQLLKLSLFKEFRTFRFIFEEHMKNELLANFIEEKPWDTVMKILLKQEKDGGIYDYSFPLREAYLEVSDANRKHVQNVLDRVFRKEYRVHLLDSIAILKTLEDKGLERQQIAFLLMGIPLRRWQHVAERIINKKR